MKIVVIFAVALAVLGAYTVSLRHAMAQSSSSSSSAAGKTESPFYCNRKAIGPDQIRRKEELNATLHSLRRSTHELDNGYEFEFPSDPPAIQAVAEWAAMEKLCCPFFDIDLRLEREGGPFFLRLTGRDGVKQFIQGEFSRWFQSAL
ncbi:MAG TPA: hypothetical protein VKW06_04005 [Candidatus Angelobacter sp.]|nr:hypothetical protein [Candidatus Angelobacter sp.]